MVNGFLNLYKPSGITSMEAVRQIKKPLGRIKVGHCGTLDPLAEGVLPIAIGTASRIVEYVLHESKTYKARIQLGQTTDTFDSEGIVTNTHPTSHITSQLIQDTLKHYLGNISQVPPIFSALKRQGKPLYKYAREGQQIAIEPREVIIHNIDLLAVTNPYIDLRVECGAGTYIRSLAHDLGNSLGCGGHLSALIREDSSGFNIADTVSLATITKTITQSPEDILKYLLPIDAPIKYIPKLGVTHLNALALRHGRPIPAHNHHQEWDSRSPLRRAYNPSSTFISIIEFNDSNGTWKPVKVFY